VLPWAAPIFRIRERREQNKEEKEELLDKAAEDGV
jgi:hypothetical protein